MAGWWALRLAPTLLTSTHTHPSPSPQVEFLPQCNKVAIMDEGTCVYFGPWNAEAQQLLGKYLPASHLLAAAGNAEQPRDTKKKAEKKDDKKGATVSAASGGAGWVVDAVAAAGAAYVYDTFCCAHTVPSHLMRLLSSLMPPQVEASKNKVHSASVPLKAAIL